MKAIGLFLFSAVLSVLLSGCQLAPTGLERSENLLIDYRQLAQAETGQQVRLGGKVIKAAVLKNNTTEVEILSLPIDRFTAKPVLESQSNGRFIAVLQGFVDPLNLDDHYITVKGSLMGYQNGKIDEATYRYPRINADEFKIWQQVTEYYRDADDWHDYWEARRHGYFGGFPEQKTRIGLR